MARPRSTSINGINHTPSPLFPFLPYSRARERRQPQSPPSSLDRERLIKVFHVLMSLCVMPAAWSASALSGGGRGITSPRAQTGNRPPCDRRRCFSFRRRCDHHCSRRRMRGPMPAAHCRRVIADATDADVRRGRATGIRDQRASLLHETFPCPKMMTWLIVLVPVEWSSPSTR